MVLKKLSFLSLILCASCAGNNGQGDAIPVESLSGKELFTNNCTACHGDDGKAGVGGATDLTISTMSHIQIKKIIEQGKKAMPPQTHAYNTDEELENLIDFVISLRKN